MDLQISNFLKSKRVTEDGKFYTHVALINPLGKYNIERKHIEDFWKTYCNLLYTNPNAIIGLAETPKEFFTNP